MILVFVLCVKKVVWGVFERVFFRYCRDMCRLSLVVDPVVERGWQFGKVTSGFGEKVDKGSTSCRVRRRGRVCT